MEMEEEKKTLHPSLPSNYVTLAQLQQRWLQQQQQQQQEEEQKIKHQQQKEEEQKIKHQGSQQHQQRRNGYTWKNRIDRHRQKTGTDSVTNAENQRESECEAAIGDGNADRKITIIESAKNENEEKNKKWKVKPKRKPKVEERGTKEEAKTEEKREDSEKGKTEISSELKEEKKIDGSIVEEIEQKIGDFSLSAMNNNERGRGRRGYFRQSQSRRGSYGGGRGCGYGYGGGFRRQQNEVRATKGEKMVWVRKSDNVGSGGNGIET